MAKSVSFSRYVGRTIVLAGLGATVIGLGVTVGNGIHGNAMAFTLVSISLAGGVLGAIIGGLNYKRFVAPMEGIIHHIEQVAQGDLLVRMNQDKVGELRPIAVSINQMSDTWQSLILHVHQTAEKTASLAENLSVGAEQTSESTNQIVASIQDMASGAEIQAAGAQEMSRAMEEMAAGIQRIAEKSSLVSEASNNMSEKAENGNETVQAAVQQMNSLHSSVNHSAGMVKRLGDRSQAIGQIVEVITGISSQTNLLALNAAIEAARAGEHGRGFAVVASEVRKLAEQSEESARQIAELIEEIQADTTLGITSMDTGLKEVTAGLERIKAAGETFREILADTKNVAAEIQEVSAASEEMSAGAEEVTASVNELRQISKTSEANAQHAAESSGEQLAAMEQVAQSAVALRQLGHELQNLIGKFQVGVK